MAGFSVPAELRDAGRMRFDNCRRNVEAAKPQQRTDDQKYHQLGYSARQCAPAGSVSAERSANRATSAAWQPPLMLRRSVVRLIEAQGASDNLPVLVGQHAGKETGHGHASALATAALVATTSSSPLKKGPLEQRRMLPDEDAEEVRDPALTEASPGALPIRKEMSHAVAEGLAENTGGCQVHEDDNRPGQRDRDEPAHQTSYPLGSRGDINLKQQFCSCPAASADLCGST
jgi:hypothetical protein